MKTDLPFRQVHLDFHTSELIPDVGAAFSKEDFQAALKEGNVDSVTLFAKCHHGWSYYPTKIGAPHPHLAREDLLGEQLGACAEIGVAAPVYITVQWDERTAREHPEWRVMKADGGSGQEQLSPVWHPLCLSNDELIDTIIRQAEEVIRLYRPVGLFFDILLPWECVCPNCVRRMKDAGRNAALPSDRLANHRDLILDYYRRVAAAVRNADPDCRIFHNSGHIPKGERERWRHFSHLELESLPTGGWGWDHFPISARYANTLGLQYLGMSGKFHSAWGEFGGYKTAASLEYECASMVAQGARCSIGDQLHPQGKMDVPTYRRLGAAYRRVEKLEPYAVDAHPVSEVAIFGTEAAAAARRSRGEGGVSSVSAHVGADSDAGAARVLLEGHFMFDVIDEGEDFGKYKVLVLPDDVRLDETMADKLRAFVSGGGRLLLSGCSGMDVAASRFLLDLGVDYDGRESPWEPDYVAVRSGLFTANSGAAGSNGAPFGPGAAALRLVESPFVVYERARRVKARGAEILAAVHEPYFNRTWDAFCSHQHTPARIEPSDAYDAVMRNGNIIYFSHPIFTAYKRSGQPLHRDLAIAALDLLLSQPAVAAQLPSAGRLTLMRQEGLRRTILHLLHAQPSLRGSAVYFERSYKAMEIVEDAVPLRGVLCRFRADSRPSSVRLVMAGIELDYAFSGGVVEFTVPEVYIHEAVVIED